MCFPRFAVVKLTLLSDRMFLYIQNELSTEVIDAYFIPEASNNNTKLLNL